MNIPLYQSSSVVRWGMEKGSGGRHRRTSLTIACIYGRFGRSENLGTRDRPTTVSSSAWAHFCISGFAIIASAHQLIALYVVWVPAVLLKRFVRGPRGQKNRLRTHNNVPTIQAISRLESPFRSEFLTSVALMLGRSHPLYCNAVKSISSTRVPTNSLTISLRTALKRASNIFVSCIKMRFPSRFQFANLMPSSAEQKTALARDLLRSKSKDRVVSNGWHKGSLLQQCLKWNPQEGELTCHSFEQRRLRPRKRR